MWVGHEYPGDNNEALKMAQFHLYGEMLLRLFSRARDRYLDAGRLVEVETELARRAKAMNTFDHRTLQGMHDLIAAWYRFSRDDGGQLRLGESPEDYEKRLATEWRDFFEDEVARIVSLDEFTRDILRATVFANTDPGYAAEACVRERLKERYAAMYRPRAMAQDGAV
jgi:hypothetical protein